MAEDSRIVHHFDQAQAEALQNLRNCRGFIIVTSHSDGSLNYIDSGHGMDRWDAIHMFDAGHDVTCRTLYDLIHGTDTDDS